MHFTPLLLAACLALRGLAAPLLVAKSSDYQLDDWVGDHHTHGNNHPLPSSNHLSPPRRINALVFEELLVPQPWDEGRHEPLLIDHSTGMFPRSTPNIPSGSATKKTKKKEPKLKPTSTTITPSHNESPEPQFSPVPSVNEMKKHIRIEPDKSLFYCGREGFMAAARLRAKNTGEKILAMAWTNQRMPKFVKKRFGPVGKDLFWDNASRAFAELSSGTVHVLLEDDVDLDNFHADSVWARVEWPALQTNTRVTKVVKVTKAGAERTLLVRTNPLSL